MRKSNLFSKLIPIENLKSLGIESLTLTIFLQGPLEYYTFSE